MEETKHPECGNEEIWKAGKTRGKQQYQCKQCKRKFIRELNYGEESKRKIIQIFYEVTSGRAVGILIKINKSTVYNWIKESNNGIEKSKPDIEREPPKEIIEMDELFSCTKHKKQNISDNPCDKKTQTNCGFSYCI